MKIMGEVESLRFGFRGQKEPRVSGKQPSLTKIKSLITGRYAG
jgi:hypothetical protein